MASNGYVRKDCAGCLFHSYDREYGAECTLRKEGFDSDGMRWVSANDCDQFPQIKAKHFEPCKHRVSKNRLKQAYRKLFGFSEED